MATEITLPPGVSPTSWLLEKKRQLADAKVELDGLYKDETDFQVKQKRRQVLFECEGALNRVKRMLMEDAVAEISLIAPNAELVSRTQQLAYQLGQKLLGERKFSAKLKLFSDISKMLTHMIAAP